LLQADGFGTKGIDISLVSQYSWCVLRRGISDDNLACDLATADLFVPATSGGRAVGEGFGLVLLEAQVAGTPVIAPAYGGSCEVFVEGVTRVALADGSAEALTRTLHAAQWTRQAFAPEHYAKVAVRRLL
jgi:glycosyltransferase involved in cell wall biosynthesis